MGRVRGGVGGEGESDNAMMNSLCRGQKMLRACH